MAPVLFYLAFLGSVVLTVAIPVFEDSDIRDESRTEESGSHVMVQSQLYGGDMRGSPNNARTNIWPGGVIPYEIHSSLSAHRSKLTRAMEDYHKSTCIKFRPKTSSDRNYIRLQNGAGCDSYVGRVNIVPQPVNLNIRGCLSHSTIVHELGHAVGFGHTHQRSDRGQFININWDNIMDEYKSAFEVERGTRNLVAYDTKSVMHYDSYAASKNRKPTMTTKNGGIITDPPGLAASDIQAIKILYKC